MPVTWDSEDDWRRLRDGSGVTNDGLGDHSGNGILDHGYVHGSLTRGLVAYYSLDDDSDSTTAIEKALGNNGTINGASYTTGKIGQALSFDGADDYVDLPGGIIPSSGPVTIASWITTTNSDSVNRYIFDARGDSDLILGWDDTTSGEFSYWLDGTWYSSGQVINNGNFHHVVFSSDGSTGRAYINGSHIDTISHTTADTYSATPSIGASRDNSGAIWDGIIDELRIYDRHLSFPEVQALYNRTSPHNIHPEDLL